MTALTAFAAFMIVFMFVALLKGDSGYTTIMWIIMGVSPVLGMFVTRVILLYLVAPPNYSNCGKSFITVMSFWSADSFKALLHTKLTDS